MPALVEAVELGRGDHDAEWQQALLDADLDPIYIHRLAESLR